MRSVNFISPTENSEKIIEIHRYNVFFCAFVMCKSCLLLKKDFVIVQASAEFNSYQLIVFRHPKDLVNMENC